MVNEEMMANGKTAERILYQFPQSHFAEKGRWLLDHKGLAYKTRNLYPVLNRVFLWPKTGVMTIPALNDGGHWVGDSTRMALYLDATYSNLPPLLSSNPTIRDKQLHINQLAESLGILIRQYVMIYLIDTSIPPALYYQDAPLSGHLRTFATWIFRAAVKALYNAHPKYIPLVTEKITALLDEIEEYVINREHPEFLTENHPGLADIALASMLAPLLAPEGSPWHSIATPSVNPAFIEVAQSVAQRPIGEFVYALYGKHRHSQNNWRGQW